MELSEEERQWTKAIQTALQEQDPELAATITDFELAQHALIAKDSTQKALKRIHRLQVFRQEHDIGLPSTPEMALATIQKFESMTPGMILSFGKSTETTTNSSTTSSSTQEQDDSQNSHQEYYVTTWDYAAFLPATYKNNPDDWKACFAAFYYLLDAMQPDLEAVRAGIVILCDAKDLGWRNFSLEMERHAAHLYQDAYPLRMHNMTMLHAPVMFKAMYALCKPFLSAKIKQAIVLNATLEQHVQGKFAKRVLPTTMGGTQDKADMELQLQKALTLRYENMATFTLL